MRRLSDRIAVQALRGMRSPDVLVNTSLATMLKQMVASATVTGSEVVWSTLEVAAHTSELAGRVMVRFDLSVETAKGGEVREAYLAATGPAWQAREVQLQADLAAATERLAGVEDRARELARRLSEVQLELLHSGTTGVPAPRVAVMAAMLNGEIESMRQEAPAPSAEAGAAWHS